MTRAFIANLFMVLLLLMVSGYEMTFYYVATAHGELLRLDDHLVYAAWVAIWTFTVGVGIEVIKAYWRATAEEIDPVAEAVGPILLEGGI